MRINLKKSLSAVVVAVAVSGAFATDAMAEKASKASDRQGYVRVNGNQTNCQPADMCSETGNQICTVNLNPSNPQLYGLDAFGNCTQILYRP